VLCYPLKPIPTFADETVPHPVSSNHFWMSNIGLMLSPHPLHHSQLKFATKVSDIYLYQVTSRMGEALQILSSVPPTKEGNITLPDPRKLNTLTPEKILDQGDLLDDSYINYGGM
jgi:hypothetical protein